MSSFLSPILRTSPDRFALRNVGTGRTIADHLLTAFDSASRNVGLLRHDSLPDSTALIIAPTSAIHTFFMKFPIDVAFVAKDGRVLKACSTLVPWRMAGAWRAYAVIEMSAGSLARSGTIAGHHLEVAARE